MIVNEHIDKTLAKAKEIKQEYIYEEKETEEMTIEGISSTIEHTNLKPTATSDDIKQLCEEAIKYNFRSVCIHPSYIPIARDFLGDSPVKIVTVIGFPLGANTSLIKSKETENAISIGADEIDMVINQGRLQSGSFENVFFDIHKVVKTAGNIPVKVIIEACNLTQEGIIIACLISEEAGAKYVKTSTGFGKHGATLEDVSLMRYCVSNNIKVKAAGGIRDLETAKKMIANGAALLGTSSGIKILQGQKVNGTY